MMRAETVCRRRITIRFGNIRGLIPEGPIDSEWPRRSAHEWSNVVVSLREETVPGAGANLHPDKRKTTGAPTPIAFISIAKWSVVFANRFIANV
jgi:hypothetical protein